MHPPAVGAGPHRALSGALLVGAGFVWLYWSVLLKLAEDWSHDPNYSHGFVVVPLALYFAWDRREALRATPIRPSWAGAALLAVGLFALLAGVRGAELFLQRTSMLLVIAGLVALTFGWRHLRLLLFPLAFLLLMIPLPSIVFNQITFPLQLLASRFGETVLDTAGIPALREGNVILLPYTTLEVVEACSGIRSLVSLATVGLAFAYLQRLPPAAMAVVVASTIPLAIVMNGLRVAGTGVAAHLWGSHVADGFLHTFSGWLVFLATCAALLLVLRGVERWTSVRARGVMAAGPIR